MRAPLLVLAVSLAGCASRAEPAAAECVAGSRPAFRLTLSAEDGPLPADTALEVVFGGGDETWAAADPGAPGKSVFCRPGLADPGADATPPDASFPDGGAIDAITCELWTSGAARVTVHASGYADVDRELAAESGACGLVTKDVAVVLERGD